MIKALAAKGGVIQINYHVGFLSQEFRNADKANPEMGKAMQEEIKKRCGENEGCQLTEGDKLTGIRRAGQARASNGPRSSNTSIMP